MILFDWQKVINKQDINVMKDDLILDWVIDKIIVIWD